MVPPTILHQLASLRRRERLLDIIWGGVRLLAVVFAVLIVACAIDWLVDRWQDTPLFLRVALFVLQPIVWVAAAVWLLARSLARPLSDSLLALKVEDRVADFEHRLITAVQLNQPDARKQGMSPELIALVTQEAESRSAQTNFTQVADHRRLRWAGVIAGSLALIAIVMTLLAPATVGALLLRQVLMQREIPRYVHLHDETAAVWPSGEPVVLTFRATGPGLGERSQGLVLIQPDGQRAEAYPLVFGEKNEDGVTFTATIPAKEVGFHYRAWLHDGRTKKPARIRLEPRPAIIRQEAYLQLPEYCGLRPNGKPFEYYQDKGEVVGLLDLNVRIVAEAQKPIVEATLEILGGATAVGGPERVVRLVPMKIAANSAEGIFDLRRDETGYRIVVTDSYGFTNTNPARRGLTIAPDEPPFVALLPERFPAAGELGLAEDTDVEGMPVPLGKTIRIAYYARAFLGLRKAQLRYRVNEGDWQRLPLAEIKAGPGAGAFDLRQGVFETSTLKDQIEFHAVASLDPEEPGRLESGGRFDFQTRALENLKVGDQVEFYVEVFDQNPDPDRQPGKSEARIKRVITDEQFVDWVLQTLQQESKIRQLEERQRGVFGPRR